MPIANSTRLTMPKCLCLQTVLGHFIIPCSTDKKEANRQSGLLARFVNMSFTNNVSWLGDPRGHYLYSMVCATI
ncbi:hypothetical protein THOD04_60217 [Vibrio owensii]|nr:hypothetical protein THZB04_60217 [Vibrio owensii]CAH1598261.1 hypothetical protein THOD04_60217 [Vibrio owensii]